MHKNESRSQKSKKYMRSGKRKRKSKMTKSKRLDQICVKPLLIKSTKRFKQRLIRKSKLQRLDNFLLLTFIEEGWLYKNSKNSRMT